MARDLSESAYVLSKRYEDHLFATAPSATRVVPVVVVTGFLGSGKTTLVQHLLLNGSQLRLGILVNEVGTIDIDSKLLKADQANATVGVKGSDLAGGCACCSVHGELEAALAEMSQKQQSQQLDYLLLETSGVADAEPLAASLSQKGYRLACVVTVVDVEQGKVALEQAIAAAQVRAADVVVLNKCDLVGLGPVSDVEDAIQDIAAGVRMLRARFGQIPPEVVFDMPSEAEEAAMMAPVTGPASTATAKGEVAFLSHESNFNTGIKRAAGQGPRVPRVLQQQQQPASAQASVAQGAAAGAAHDHTSPHHHHHHQAHEKPAHSHFSTVPVSATEPLCMACFQSFVTGQLLKATGLFRAKGLLWFQQQRSSRYVFHLSGKQRVECRGDGRWEGPPGIQLVLIGTHPQELQELHKGLMSCLASNCSSCIRNPGEPSAAGVSAAGHDEPLPSTSATATASSSSSCNQGPGGGNGEGAEAGKLSGFQQLQQVVAEHPRFLLWPPEGGSADVEANKSQAEGGTGSAGTDLRADAQCCPGLLQLSAVGSAVHGIDATEVNASVMRKINAAGHTFLCGVDSAPILRASTTGVQTSVRGVQCLQACWHGPEDERAGPAGEAWWAQLVDDCAPVLRLAYQHMHNCKCDVAGVLQLQA